MTLVRTQYVWRDLPTYLVSRYSTQLKEECIVPTLFIFVSHKIKDYNIMSPFIISLSRYFYAFVDSLLSLSLFLSFFLSQSTTTCERWTIIRCRDDVPKRCDDSSNRCGGVQCDQIWQNYPTFRKISKYWAFFVGSLITIWPNFGELCMLLGKFSLM